MSKFKKYYNMLMSHKESKDPVIKQEFSIDDIKKLKSFSELLKIGFRLISIKNKTIVLENIFSKTGDFKRTITITKYGFIQDHVTHNEQYYRPKILNQGDKTYGTSINTIDDVDNCFKFLVQYFEKHPESKKINNALFRR